MCDMCLSFETGRERWVGSTNSVSSKWLKKERKGRYMVVEPPPSLLASCTFFTTILLLLLLLLHCLDVEVFSLSSYPHGSHTTSHRTSPFFKKRFPLFFFFYLCVLLVLMDILLNHLKWMSWNYKNNNNIIFFFVSKKHVVC